MNSLLNWNDNLVAIFEAKLTFKYQSLSIASVGAVDTTNVPTFLMSSLRYKNNNGSCASKVLKFPCRL